MAEMTSKERIMNAILGKETDRTPWSPFLAYYWEHLPEEKIVNRCDHRHFQDVGTLYCKCHKKEYAKEDR